MYNQRYSKSCRMVFAALILLSMSACGSSKLAEDATVNEEMSVSKNSESLTLLNKNGWKLSTLLNEQGELVAVLPDTLTTILFQGDRLAGRSGCNNYFSAYQAEGNDLTIDKPGATMMACPEAIMKQEYHYLTLLRGVNGYQITGKQLQLLNQAGEIALVFTEDEPAELSDGVWQLHAFNTGNALMTNLITNRINISFADGKLSGFAGCNLYAASYQISADKISIRPMKVALKDCDFPEQVMQTEQGYFTALERTASYKIKGNQLTLFDEKGTRVVVYNKQQ